MNNIIINQSLNNNREYSIREIRAWNHNENEIFNYVHQSLINNVPVLLAYSGIGVNGNENTHQHFIIIYGIFVNERNERSYNYIDPGNGGSVGFFTEDNYSQINNNNIGRFFWGHNQRSSYLIYYDPNSQLQSETQIPRPNQTEPMEIGSSQSINLLDLNGNRCISTSSHNILSKRMVRNINNNESCIIPNISNPIYDKKDNINGYYDEYNSAIMRLKLNISRKTSLGIINYFSSNNLENFKVYLKTLFKSLKWNSSIWGDNIDDDAEALTYYISKNYSYFHNKALELLRNNNYNKIEIVINSIRKDDDPATHIYLIK